MLQHAMHSNLLPFVRIGFTRARQLSVEGLLSERVSRRAAHYFYFLCLKASMNYS